MIQLLLSACQQKLLRYLDVQFAQVVAGEQQPALMLVAAWVSAEAGDGHVCLPLADLTEQALFSGRDPDLAHQLWQAAGDPDWPTLLYQQPAVGDGSVATPLVLSQQCLYLYRMWHAEQQVAQFILRQRPQVNINESRLRAVLDCHFGEHTDSWQKIAAAVAITRQVAVISGGPGTGKTTTVARLLASLLDLSADTLRIQLAAPTGKAAARLTESLGKALAQAGISETNRQRFPAEATTLHRLLGAVPGSQQRRYHADNPLHVDLLVIDEASMVDLPMMAALIAALPPQAKVILLGDRDQLASVEAGAVFGDICRCAKWGYSQDRAAQLVRLTGCDIKGQDNKDAPSVRDSICLLRRSYRFDALSGIGQLALAVNAGDISRLSKVLAENGENIAHFSLDSGADYQHLLNTCVTGYSHYLRSLKQGGSAHEVIEAFGCFQLLCALREGPFGVVGLNDRIEVALKQQGWIERSPGEKGKWYVGRPIMITRNDSVLGLFNGDIGIAMHDEGQAIKVFFPLPDGTIRSVQPSRLPPCDTAFAMTVHKSQGSEFDHTLLVLPTHYTPILTRELIYTAVTRARKRLTLYADSAVLQEAVNMRTRRRSGLIARLAE